MIVVDDEAWVRERLIQTINWKRLGIDVIEEAECGSEALQKALALEPDIILTDIRMPNMGGLELIQRLKEHRIQVKVIIISGYSDFEYAKKAIELGAFYYILKPVEDQDLLQIIERCLEQIKSEKKNEDLIKRADTQVNKRLPLLKEMLFSKLITGQVQNKEEVLGALSDFHIQHGNMLHICIVFLVKNFNSMKEQLSADFIQFVVGNVAKDFLQEWSANDIIFTHSEATVAIVSTTHAVEGIRGEILSRVDDLNKIVNKILGCSLIIGIGGGCTELIDISLSYHQAKQSLLFHEYLGKEHKVANVSSSKWESYKNYYTESLVNSIKLGNKAAVLSNLELFVEQNEHITPPELKFIYFQVISVITRTTIEGKEAIEDFSKFSLEFFELLNRLQTIPDIQQLLAKAFEAIIDYLDKNQNRKKRKVIEKVVEYIGEHYNEPINLNMIAEKFYLNASYLSKIFKEEMNITFSKYMMEYRIEKAIELMKDPTKKIYEIASIVGYDDVQYFTKIFKTIKGVTPMMYREKIT